MISDMESWGKDADGNPVDGVVVGMDLQISYRKLAKAATVLKRPDAAFVATNTDEQFPHDSGVILPGTGAVVSAVATAAGRKPVVMGKPHPAMFEAVKRMRPQTSPDRTLMIGDRANTDILLGTRCGLKTLLVGTGVHSLEDTRKWEESEKQEERDLVADFYVDRIGDLVDLWTKSQADESC